MKIKQAISLLFLFSFSIYNLCPVLMQGRCGFSVVDSTSIVETSCSSCCNAEAEETSQQEGHQVGNCCFVGLELTRPNESDDLDLSQLFSTTFSLMVVLVPLPTLLPSDEAAFYPHPFQNLYEYFSACHVFPRAPPHAPLQYSYV